MAQRFDVIIAGAGVAAAALALRLLATGWRPLLLARRLPLTPGAEALPEAVLRLDGVLPVTDWLAQAGAIVLEGFEIAGPGATASVKTGRFWHVERTALARVALAEAVRRGAALRYCAALPLLQQHEGHLTLWLDQCEYSFQAAVDATGRAAAWSRPLDKHGTQVADLWHLPALAPPRCGKVVATAAGWAYRLDLPDFTTVGALRRQPAARQELTPAIRTRLNLASPASQPARYLGSRPAFPQWAAEPLHGLRLAIGDAALAQDPLAGQGVRQAWSSAVAAAAVLLTWRELPAQQQLATAYYRHLLTTERQRHLHWLENLTAPAGDQPTPTANSNPAEFALPLQLRFAARTQTAGVQQDGMIQPQKVVVLENTAQLRWLGNFDLLQLQAWCPQPVSTHYLLEHLVRQSLSCAQACLLLRWCVENKVLSGAPDL